MDSVDAIRLTTPLITKALVARALGGYHPCAIVAGDIQDLAGRVAGSVPRSVVSLVRDRDSKERQLLDDIPFDGVVEVWRDASEMRIRLSRGREALTIRSVPWAGGHVGMIDEISAYPSAAKAMLGALLGQWQGSAESTQAIAS